MMKIAAAFLLCLSLTSCAWFEKDVKPALTCAGKVVPLADITRVEQDLSPPPNYVDLAELCATVGWDIGACIIEDAKTRKPALKAAAEDFKRQHAVELRSAQPVSMGEDFQKESPPGSAPRAPGGTAIACWVAAR